MSSTKHVRIALASIVVATVAGLTVAAFASRSGAQPLSKSLSVACPAMETTRTTAPCGFPTWCCPAGTSAGVTVTGQATLKGSSAQIRDQAIARAVADAREQAEAAAAAAGVKLGQVIAMQISSSGYAYAVDSAPATTTPSGPPCPADGVCGSPVPVQTYVSVTVTWALA